MYNIYNEEKSKQKILNILKFFIEAIFVCF